MRTVVLLMLLLTSGMLVAAADSMPAAAQDTPQTVKFIGPDTFTVHLGKSGSEYTAAFNLKVENDGPLIAAPTSSGGGGYNITVVSDRNYTDINDLPTISYKEYRTLSATTVTYVPVELAVHDLDTTSLTAILTVISPSGVAPSTERITLTRSPRYTNFVGILLGSLILPVALLIALGISKIFKWEPKPPQGQNQSIIYTNSTFSFSSSWATSIAAVLTVVATVFTTTGVLTSLVPGIDTGYFLAVTIVYGVVLSLAPLVYSALEKEEGGQVYGTHCGYVAAAAVTAAAVGGQLSTVGAIISLSDLDKPLPTVLDVFLGVVALVIIWYMEATRRQLWKLPKPKDDPTTQSRPPTAPMAALP